MKNKLFVVLPAYNESSAVAPLLERLAAASLSRPLRVVLVDDGSLDDTAGVARGFASKLDLTLLSHGRNRGMAEAIRTGMTHALAHASDEDSVATMDADNSHPPEILPLLENKLAEGFDAVVASRYAAGGAEIGLSAHRKVLSRTCSRFLGALLPIPGISDYTSGYRLYRASALRRLQSATSGRFFDEDSFACTAEILLALDRLGARFAEAPLELRYDLKKSESKMKVPQTVLRYFSLARRFRKLGS